VNQKWKEIKQIVESVTMNEAAKDYVFLVGRHGEPERLTDNTRIGVEVILQGKGYNSNNPTTKEWSALKRAGAVQLANGAKLVMRKMDLGIESKGVISGGKKYEWDPIKQEMTLDFFKGSQQEPAGVFSKKTMIELKKALKKKDDFYDAKTIDGKNVYFTLERAYYGVTSAEKGPYGFDSNPSVTFYAAKDFKSILRNVPRK